MPPSSRRLPGVTAASRWLPSNTVVHPPTPWSASWSLFPASPRSYGLQCLEGHPAAKFGSPEEAGAIRMHDVPTREPVVLTDRCANRLRLVDAPVLITRTGAEPPQRVAAPVCDLPSDLPAATVENEMPLAWNPDGP